MTKLYFFSWLIPIMAVVRIASGFEDYCDAKGIQKRIECEPLECDDEVSELIEGLGRCGQCTACVRFKKYGEPCVQNPDTNVPPERIYESSACGKGLMCSDELKCEIKADVADNCDKDKDGKCLLCNSKQKEMEMWKEQYKNDPDPERLNWLWEPNCDKSSRYEPVQCKGQKCYCTQKNGKRIFGHIIRTYDGAKGDMNCACSLLEAEMLESGGKTADYDHVVCETNGNFKPFQCVRNLCFCVNVTNGEMIGTVLPDTLMNRLPCYEEKSYANSFQQTCQMQRGNEEALAHYFHGKGYDLAQLKLTKCDPDGTFAPKQCDNINCYCGIPKDGTTINPNYMVPLQGTQQLDMDCNCLRDILELGSGNLQQNPCQPNGNYDPIRCTSTFTCHCLDRDGDQSSVQEDIKEWKDTPCLIPVSSEGTRRVRECYVKFRQSKCEGIVEVTTAEP